jgi:DNA repair photolyase
MGLQMGFPVSVLERSPLVLREFNLLQGINHQLPSAVLFSPISAPDSPTCERLRQMENLAPAMERRDTAVFT